MGACGVTDKEAEADLLKKVHKGILILAIIILGMASLWDLGGRIYLSQLEAVDSSGRGVRDPGRTQDGVSGMLGIARLAQPPLDASDFRFDVRRNLRMTSVIHQAGFRTSKVGLQNWIGSSPPLASLASQQGSSTPATISIAPPQGASSAEVRVDHTKGEVTVIIRYGK